MGLIDVSQARGIRLGGIPALLLCTLCAFLATAPIAHSIQLMDDNFESYAPGDQPGLPAPPDGSLSPWTSNGTPAQVGIVDLGGNQALTFQYDNTTPLINVVRNFPVQSASDPLPVLQLDFRVRFQSGAPTLEDGLVELFLSNFSNGHGVRLRMRPYISSSVQSGFYVISGGSAPGVGNQFASVLPQVDLDVWYAVRVKADLLTQTFQVIVTNTVTAVSRTSPHFLFPAIGITEMGRFVVQQSGGFEAMDLVLDDIHLEAVETVADILPPSRPTGLGVQEVGADLQLSWSPSMDNRGSVTAYRVYRNGVFLDSVAGESYIDLGQSGLTPLRYEVSAVDPSTNESGKSEPFLYGTCLVTGGDNALTHFRLAVDFEGDTPSEGNFYGAEGLLGNPFPTAGQISLIDEGAPRGFVAEFEGHDDFLDGQIRRASERSALIFDASVLGDTGTLSFRVRWNGLRGWADTEESWLAFLAPLVGEVGFSTDETGTGLAIVKDATGHLVLAIHQFERAAISADYRDAAGLVPATETPIAIDVSSFADDDWIQIRLAWEKSSGRVSLGAEAIQVPGDTIFGDAPWRSLAFGTPPSLRDLDLALGFDGQIDSIVVDDRYAPDLHCEPAVLPAELPASATPAPATAAQPTFFAGDTELELVEEQARQHLARVLEMQAFGGWRYRVAYPSFMPFLSQNVVIPFSDRYVNGAKAGNSAGIALRVLAAYEVLGEPAYLAAARECADRLITFQHDDPTFAGALPYGALMNPLTGELAEIFRRDIMPIEDHVQTHPIALFWRLFDLTGDVTYRDAADLSLASLLSAQNPNGSWSHHVNVSDGFGETFGNERQGGELTDFTTTETMTIMLWAYRRSGDSQYLVAYLAAAEWLVDAAIRNEFIAGWAGQYDDQDNPVDARPFEPPGISLNEGMTGPPLALLEAYRMTGHVPFLAPVFAWRNWMRDAELPPDPEGMHQGGWYPYYHHLTGEPIKYVNGISVTVDPRDVGRFGMTGVLDAVDDILSPYPSYASDPATIANDISIESTVVAASNTIFDSAIGSWGFGDTLHGVILSPSTSRLMPMLRALFLGRQRNGGLPYDHRFSAMTRSDWYDVLAHEYARADLIAPLTQTELDAVGFVPVPEPAFGIGLASALLGLVAATKRSKSTTRWQTVQKAERQYGAWVSG